VRVLPNDIHALEETDECSRRLFESIIYRGLLEIVWKLFGGF